MSRRAAAYLFTADRGATRPAIACLPRRSAVIFRQYDAPDRLAQARAVRAACRRRGVRFIPADAPGPKVRGDGLHRPAYRTKGPRRRWPRGLRTAAAHNPAELTAARRARAHLVFLAPVFATQSHADACPLGRVRFGLLARRSKLPVAALGGVTAKRFRSLRALGAVAWGAISAFQR